MPHFPDAPAEFQSFEISVTWSLSSETRQQQLDSKLHETQRPSLNILASLHSMPITTCGSLETLRTEIDAARKKVGLDETEDTWDTITKGVLQLTHLCNSGGCDFPSEMVAGIRSMSRPLNSALNSERSRLSGAAIELLTALSTGLGPSFEPLVSQFFPTLLALCARTNKVFTSRAKACILSLVQQTRLPSLIPHIAELANHKSVFLRLTAAETILACLNCFNPPDLEKETRARTVEDFIKSTACDASADVRKTSKEIFKAYKLLMPARVDNFVAALTPVVKKYLDIQTGPSGIHAASSNAGQKQTSRPSSRANNAVTEAGRRPTTSTLSKPSARPAIDNPPHNTRQRPVTHAPPTTADIRAPRQRTVSQMQRDPPQSRNLQINAQPSSVAQRCVIPTSAPAMRHPLPSAARVPSARNASTTTGPQRPPPMQIKFNPPARFKPTGSGAQRVPLPSVPMTGSAGDQAAASTKSVDRAGSTIDKPHSKLPTRSTEAVVSGKSVVGQKASEGTRSAPFPAKATSVPAPTRLAPGQRKPSGKGGLNNPSKIAPQQRPVGTVQKRTRPLVTPEPKETLPTLIPLPPSPSTPIGTPLPPSPDCTPHPADPEAPDDPVLTPVPATSDPAEGRLQSCEERGDMGNPSTPITTLLFSIQRGFLFTPSSPLSPPQNYLPAAPGDLPERQDMVIASNLAKGPSARGPFCIPLEDVVDGLDRHALKDLN